MARPVAVQTRPADVLLVFASFIVSRGRVVNPVVRAIRTHQRVAHEAVYAARLRARLTYVRAARPARRLAAFARVLLAQAALHGEALGAQVVAAARARRDALRVAALEAHGVFALGARRPTLVAQSRIAVGAFVLGTFEDKHFTVGALASQRLQAVRPRGDGRGAHVRAADRIALD